MRACVPALLPFLLCAATACGFERDSVAGGYYGAMGQAGRRATGMPSSSAGATPSRPSPQPAGGSSAAASGGAGAPADRNAAGAAPSSGTAERNVAGAAPSSGAAGAPNPPAPTAPPASGVECDLSGRWLNTLHYTTDGLGNLQTAHKLIYYEIEQKADALTIKKGMQCGNDTIGGGAFAITGDFSGARTALMQKVTYAGRTGTSTKVANGCKIDIAKLYTVIGATVPHYLDPATALPTVEVKATGSMPGWEDWDGDGNPGVTGIISGTITGKIFVATREWTSMSGTVPNVKSVFTLPLRWDQEPNVMAFDGSPFLGAEAVRAADASLHFAQFARLAPDQAVGDDAAICKSIVQLAATLTPEASASAP